MDIPRDLLVKKRATPYGKFNMETGNHLSMPMPSASYGETNFFS
jgi:hypothetical protein